MGGLLLTRTEVIVGGAAMLVAVGGGEGGRWWCFFALNGAVFPKCICNVKTYNRRVEKKQWTVFGGVSVRHVRAFEAPPLRLFVALLCHAACRIVTMAEDTEGVRGGGVGHRGDGGEGVHFTPFTCIFCISLRRSGRAEARGLKES